MLHQKRNQGRICVPNAAFRPLFCSIAFLALTSGCLKANALAYAMMNSAQGQTFGTLDLDTGAFSAINGNEDAMQGGVAAALSLASFGGNLYALGGSNNSTLFQVNTTTGNLTAISSAVPANSSTGLGSTTSGVYVAVNSGSLDSLNPLTAATMAISGNSFLPAFSEPYALSENGSVLLLSDNTTLFSVNLTNGALTTIGNFGVGISMDAMLFEGGVLYGAAGRVSIDTINTTTGAATTLAAGLSGTGTANAAIAGLAPDVQVTSSTPEPSSLLLMGLGLAGFAFIRRRSAR